MKTTKKVIALAMVLLLVLSLCACSAKDQTAAPAEPEATAKSDVPAEPAASEESGDTDASEAPAEEAPAEAGEIIVAATVPMTGEPVVSYATIQGLEMAAEEINAAGGILGNKMTIIWEDMGTTPDVALNAVNKIIARGDVNVHVGINYSGSALAVEEVIEEAKLPTFTGGTSPLLADINNPYVFRGRTGDRYMVDVALSYIQGSLGVAEGGTIALLYNNNDFGVGALNILTEKCADAQINLVSEAYNVDDSDVTTQILSLKAQNPDVVLVWSSVNGFPVASRAIYEQGMDCPVFAASSASMQSVIDTCDPWMNGWYSLSDCCMDNPDPAIQAFASNYTEKYGTDTLNFAAAYSYSWAYLIKDAYERAGSTDTEAFVKAMNETEGFTGLNGTYSRFAEIEMLNCGSVGIITDGKFVFEKIVDANAK